MTLLWHCYWPDTNPYHMLSFNLAEDVIISYFFTRENQIWEKYVKILAHI